MAGPVPAIHVFDIFALVLFDRSARKRSAQDHEMAE
jgi:hypothetical protein